MQLLDSTRQGKRLMAIFRDGRVVHFGMAGGMTYIDTGDKARRAAYLARHSVRENWEDPYSAGALSRWLLWGDSKSLEKNHKSYMKRFPETDTHK